MTFFRSISLLEGLSYLIILSVTLGVIPREYVFPLGITHGVLFLVYVFSSFYTSHKQAWSLITWLLVFAAALVPFAFIAVEVFIRKQVKASAVSTEATA